MRGTIQKINETTYRLYVSGGFDYKGKRIRYSKTYHGTKSQAERELVLFEAECIRGNINKPERITLEEFAKTVLDMKEANLKPSTFRMYRLTIEQHINGSIGTRALSSIKTIHVQSWITDIYNSGLSAKTCKNVFSVLSVIMDTAVKWDMISANPCTKVELPKVKKHEAESFTSEEADMLVRTCLNADKSEFCVSVGILVGLLTGLRRSEVLGLDYSDIDFEKKTLTVNKNRMVVTGKGLIEVSPKTESSKRTIAVPEVLLDHIRRWKIYQSEQALLLGEEYTRSDVLITGYYGRPIHPSTFDKHYKDFLHEHGLRFLSFHKLRHTHASMLGSVATPKEISARLGHTQLSTTLNIYTHIFEDSDRKIADALQKWHESGTEAK